MKKIDLSAVPPETGSSYPVPFDSPCSAQSSQRLARHAGLAQFGVNLTVIEPGEKGYRNRDGKPYPPKGP